MNLTPAPRPHANDLSPEQITEAKGRKIFASSRNHSMSEKQATAEGSRFGGGCILPFQATTYAVMVWMGDTDRCRCINNNPCVRASWMNKQTTCCPLPPQKEMNISPNKIRKEKKKKNACGGETEKRDKREIMMSSLTVTVRNNKTSHPVSWTRHRSISYPRGALPMPRDGSSTDNSGTSRVCFPAWCQELTTCSL